MKNDEHRWKWDRIMSKMVLLIEELSSKWCCVLEGALVRHGVPRSLTPADELLVSLAVREILADLRQMSTKQRLAFGHALATLQAV